MYSKLFFIFIFIFMFFLLHIQAQDMNQVKKNLQNLTSATMHGRGYVKKGDKKAANYIKNEFKKLNVKPFTQNYFQSFPINVNTFPNRMALQIGNKKLKAGNDFIIDPASKSGKGQGKLFIFDSSAMQSKKKLKELSELDANSFVILVEEKMEKELEKFPSALLQKIYTAKAIIEIVKGKRTVGHVSKSATINPYFKITKQTWQNLQEEINNNDNVIFEVDAEVLNNYSTKNVLGYIEGSAVKDSFLIVSAHYDHLGRMGKTTYFPGANDNASGVSMVLALAEYFSKNPPRYSVAFFLFGGEEIGLLGSEHFVKNPLIPLEKIKFLFNLDIVGTGDTGATIVNSTVFKDEFERLKKINQQKNYLSLLQTRGKAPNSDHHHFVEKGVKAFYLYTMGGVSYYHDVDDKAETLPLTKYKEVFGLIKDFFEGF
ncbi:MAG: M28 family peptidase [Cytophagales bacterium]|nr:MAG: M28 family peptidase [Cytophagales bacterium]